VRRDPDPSPSESEELSPWKLIFGRLKDTKAPKIPPGFGRGSGLDGMNPERWQRVKAVFDGALAVASDQQSVYLAQACQDDQDLRSEVEALLRHHERAASRFLNQPAVHLQDPPPNTDGPPSRLGRRVGVYQIIEEIGRGGMGEVYRAARIDGTYQKQVALKIVRGGYDTASVLERFRNERQILASLDHPNIARLLDGGTTEGGIPYLVMELIEGIPIDQYCDQRALTITQRLQIFRQVCSAVQFAHQHLVIHRDIKPSNILVTNDGVPKLLDFGIAKILDPAENAEPTLARPMTPEYASPEQVLGHSITTATDIYSLGVVLYQLLTGRSPYTVKTRASHELSKAICDVDPERPSTRVVRREPDPRLGEPSGSAPEEVSRRREGSTARLRRRLAGDLDNIVARALRKEPLRRYASAEQFSEDIRRHGDGLPVIARRDSWKYRTGKFVQRHQVGVAAAALVALAVLAGVAATVREARIAELHRQRAEARFNDVRKIAHSLMFDIHDSVATLPGSTPTLKLLVQDSQEYLDTLAKEAAGDVSLQRDLATAYEKLGNTQGNPSESNLGDAPAALQSFQKSLAIRQAIVGASPDNPEDQSALAGAYRLIAFMQWATVGDTGKAWDNIQKAVAIAEPAHQRSSNVKIAAELGMDYETRGIMLEGDGQTAGLSNPRAGMEDHQKALALYVQVAAAYPGDIKKQRKIPMLNLRLGDELIKLGDREGALRYYRTALDLMLHMPQDPNNRILQRDLLNGYSAVGDVLLMNGRAPEAEDSFEKELESIQSIAAADASDTSTALYLAAAHADVGRGAVEQGDTRKGISFLRKAVAEGEHLGKMSSANWDATSLAQFEIWLGHALGRAGEREEETQLYSRALTIYKRITDADTKDIQDAIAVAECHVRLAGAWLRAGDLSRARQESEQALALAKKVAPQAPESIDVRYLEAATYSGMGDVGAAQARVEPDPRQQSERWKDAQSWYQQSLQVWSKVPNPSPIAPNEFQVDLPAVVEKRLAECKRKLSKTENFSARVQSSTSFAQRHYLSFVSGLNDLS
jgi:eukaryotic-like serine/threonine-protein kinase